MQISIRFTFEKLLMLKVFTKILFVHSTKRTKVSKYCQLSCTDSIHTHNHLMALCPGLPGWAGTRTKHSPTHHPD